MTDVLTIVSWVWMAVAVAVGFVLTRVPAPYGRHRSGTWGPEVSDRLGWIVMETVSPAALVAAAWISGGDLSGGSALLAACWLGHYGHRAFVYPMLSRKRGRRMPLVVVASAVVFNAVNGSLNGLALTVFRPSAGLLCVGLAVWLAGLAINVHSDVVLRRLRERSPDGYAVPRGGLFRWVSSPNYLGEIIEWTGFALAAWNPAALSFAVWTLANLLPRAVANHRWYHERFPDYPARRRALIPGVL